MAIKFLNGQSIAGNLTVSGVVSATGGNSTQWNSAYAKTNAFTTIGTNFTKIPNVSVVSYTRINANETISLLSASQFRSAIGAGTSSSSGVTSVATGNGISGGTITSTGTLTVSGGDGLTQTSTGLEVDSTVVRTTGAQSVAGTKTFTSVIVFSNSAGFQTSRIDCRGGQQIVLNAGESSGQATGQTAENVYINAEAGLQVNSSPDNWSSGWAGRNAAYINRADATSFLPGVLTVATGITITGIGRIQGVDTVTASTDAANKAYVDAREDTGVPAILSNGSTPSLNSGITALEVRNLIGAGTSSSSGVTSISADTAGNRLGIAVKDGSTSTPEIGLNINGLATKGSPENWDTASITLLAFDGDETDDNVQIEIIDLLALAGSVDGSGTNGYIPKWNGSTGLNNSSTLYNGVSGRLNINNTFTGNPSYGSDADLFIVGHNATTAACLTLMNGDTTASPQQETGKIEFGIKDDASSGYISTRILSRVTSTPGQGYAGRGQLELQTSSGGSGSSPNTRVVVDYRGYVGLNELTPDERLEVKGAIKATDYKSSDGSTGITGTFTIVDKYSATRTLTIKNGLITAKN